MERVCFGLLEDNLERHRLDNVGVKVDVRSCQVGLNIELAVVSEFATT